MEFKVCFHYIAYGDPPKNPPSPSIDTDYMIFEIYEKI